MYLSSIHDSSPQSCRRPIDRKKVFMELSGFTSFPSPTEALLSEYETIGANASSLTAASVQQAIRDQLSIRGTLSSKVGQQRNRYVSFSNSSLDSLHIRECSSPSMDLDSLSRQGSQMSMASQFSGSRSQTPIKLDSIEESSPDHDTALTSVPTGVSKGASSRPPIDSGPALHINQLDTLQADISTGSESNLPITSSDDMNIEVGDRVEFPSANIVRPDDSFLVDFEISELSSNSDQSDLIEVVGQDSSSHSRLFSLDFTRFDPIVRGKVRFVDNTRQEVGVELQHGAGITDGIHPITGKRLFQTSGNQAVFVPMSACRVVLRLSTLRRPRSHSLRGPADDARHPRVRSLSTFDDSSSLFERKHMRESSMSSLWSDGSHSSISSIRSIEEVEKATRERILANLAAPKQLLPGASTEPPMLERIHSQGSDWWLRVTDTKSPPKASVAREKKWNSSSRSEKRTRHLASNENISLLTDRPSRTLFREKSLSPA